MLKVQYVLKNGLRYPTLRKIPNIESARLFKAGPEYMVLILEIESSQKMICDRILSKKGKVLHETY